MLGATSAFSLLMPGQSLLCPPFLLGPACVPEQASHILQLQGPRSAFGVISIWGYLGGRGQETSLSSGNDRDSAI